MQLEYNMQLKGRVAKVKITVIQINANSKLLHSDINLTHLQYFSLPLISYISKLQNIIQNKVYL